MGRWFRFGLRTLLLFVTLAAGLCSWFAVEYRTARTQRLAVAKLQSQGAYVFYDYQMDEDFKVIDADKPEPEWLRELTGADFGLRVIAVNFGDYRAKDEDLKLLRAFPDLEALAIESDAITDKGLAEVVRLRRLRALNLIDARISDRGVATLTELPNLRELELLDIPGLTNEGLKHIGQMRQLRSLEIWGGGVTDEGLQHIEGLVNLKRLVLYDERLSDQAVEHLRESLPECNIQRPIE